MKCIKIIYKNISCIFGRTKNGLNTHFVCASFLYSLNIQMCVWVGVCVCVCVGVSFSYSNAYPNMYVHIFVKYFLYNLFVKPPKGNLCIFVNGNC